MPPPQPPPSLGDVSAVDGGQRGCSSAGEDRVCLLHENSGGGTSCAHCSRTDPTPPSSSCPSTYSLVLDSIPFTDSEKIRRAVTASTPSPEFIGLCAVRLSDVAELVLCLHVRFTSVCKPELFSNREAIILALKETLRYGLFLGTFAGTFVSVDEIIAALGGHRRQSRTSMFLFFVADIQSAAVCLIGV
ncbi:hypothetical protein CRG98_026863 [Punica granatum]|uniref:Uncharacterized protein n=1 Tax=Punica granatum TaxID=22663 RepID=A0A2I0J919_PUNGR|nr:hypothetical protein CRG98_026863 [Punica granatum]